MHKRNEKMSLINVIPVKHKETQVSDIKGSEKGLLFYKLKLQQINLLGLKYYTLIILGINKLLENSSITRKCANDESRCARVNVKGMIPY